MASSDAGDTSRPQPGALPVLVPGDTVYGLGAAVPAPISYIGTVCADAVSAARTLTGNLFESSVGQPLPSQDVLFIDGKPAALDRAVSVPLTTAGPPAVATSWSGAVDLGGHGLLTHAGTFSQTPTGSLQTLSTLQKTLFVQGRSMQRDPEDLAAALEESDRVVGPRVNFEPSAERDALVASRVSSLRQADVVPPESAVWVGDPVDVATGAVVSRVQDTAGQASGLGFVRHYNSRRSDRPGPLGPGWTHDYHQALWLEPGRVVLQEGDGRQLEFDTLGVGDDGLVRGGDVLVDILGRYRLRSHGHFRWELDDGVSIRHFGPIKGEGSEARDQGMARLVRRVEPGRPLVEFDYDDHARLTGVRSDGHLVLGLRYDSHDRIESLWAGSTQSLSRITRYEYSSDGDLVTVTDLLGHQRHYEYREHLLVRETNRVGGSFYYGYDGCGPGARCIRNWADGGKYDRELSYSQGRTDVKDSLGHRTSYRVGPTNLVTMMVGPVGGKRAYRYDGAMRLVKIAYEDATVARALYDDAGRLLQQTGRGGDVWRYRYDEDGNLVEATSPVGGTWSFARDGLGNLTRVADPIGHVTRIEYEAGRPSRIVNPLGQSLELTVGANDEILSIETVDGARYEYEYDGQGRLSRARHRDRTVAWAYDGLGRVVAVQSESEAVSVERDAEGEVVALARDGGSLRVRRDAFGNVEAVESDECLVQYGRDSEGRIETVRTGGKLGLQLRHDPRGLVVAYVVGGRDGYVVQRSAQTGAVTSRTRESGERIDLEWDKGGRLTRWQHSQGRWGTFSYREDGLMIGHATRHHQVEIRRDKRGVVVGQRCGEVEIASAETDFAGRRYGFDIQDGPSVAYLWAVDGTLDRIAVTRQTSTDVQLEPLSATQTQVRCGDHTTLVEQDLWGRGPRPSAAAADVDRSSTEAVEADALHRPLRSARGDVVYDEDRIVLEGEFFHVRDPRTGVALVEVDEAGRAVAGARHPLDDVPAVPHDEAFEAFFPLRSTSEVSGIERAVVAPFDVLSREFDCAIWRPLARPVPGRRPWDVEDWEADVGDDFLRPPTTRLDQQSLLELLCPLQRAGLSL